MMRAVMRQALVVALVMPIAWSQDPTPRRDPGEPRREDVDDRRELTDQRLRWKSEWYGGRWSRRYRQFVMFAARRQRVLFANKMRFLSPLERTGRVSAA